MFRKNKGITLVVLVVTIIILLILAGISISTLTNTGILDKAKEAKSKTENTEKEEQIKLNEYQKELNEKSVKKITDEKINKVLSTEKNTTLKDENGNMVVIPAGFKIVVDDTTNNATTVDKGIVVEDATLNEDGTKTSTNGSQFVWVPVGNIKKSDGTTIEINLNRYTFDIDGIPTAHEDNTITVGDYNWKEAEEKIYGNSVAKSIIDFKISVAKNGGYYIGRYEARTEKARSSKNNALTQATEKPTETIYNYVTQNQAAQAAQEMYNTQLFTSDLINSYSWDTAILFLQNCGDNSKYSRQVSTNNSLANNGTNGSSYTENSDKQCNIYDMAGNILEWTTETFLNANSAGVYRGGYISSSYDCTQTRYGNNEYSNSESLGFRTILYL